MVHTCRFPRASLAISQVALSRLKVEGRIARARSGLDDLAELALSPRRGAFWVRRPTKRLL